MKQGTLKAKTEKMKTTLAATRAKRKTQDCKVFKIKLCTNKMNKQQKQKLEQVFTEAKWLRNHIISQPSIKNYKLSPQVTVLDKNRKPQERTLTHLGTHLKQAILTQVLQDLTSLSAKKRKNHKIGKLKYKSQVNCINLKESGRTYKINFAHSKVQVQKLGWFRARGLDQLKGFELANAKLLRKPDGYYLAVTCFKSKNQVKDNFQPGTVIGLDMGVKTHITLSDGTEYNSTVRETGRLKRLQRKLARQVKGSNNSRKTREKIAREYQKMEHQKQDFANKVVHEILLNQTVFMQDENLSQWKRNSKHYKFGRKLQHSTLGQIKAKLVRHSRVVVLRKNAPTTQACVCGARNKHQLDQRVYFCSQCGYRAPRDVHAAQNMVRLGQVTVPVGRRDFKPVENELDFKVALAVFKRCSAKREASGSSAQT